MPELRLTPEQESYLAVEDWIRRNSDRLRRRLGDESLIEITALMLAQRRALGLPTKLRAIAGRRFPPAPPLAPVPQGIEAEFEEGSRFMSPQPDGCPACIPEMEE